MTSSPKLTFDVVIRDISEVGAKLQLEKDVALPEEFELIFTNEYSRQRARLIWQKGFIAGVELIGPRAAIKLPRVL